MTLKTTAVSGSFDNSYYDTEDGCNKNISYNRLTGTLNGKRAASLCSLVGRASDG